MGIRYDNRIRNFLEDDLYRDKLKEKGVRRIAHFNTAHIGGLNASIRSKFKRIEHIWGVGDRFYKLAEQHYGNPKLWWVIAWYNTTPTETHVKVGDTIKIPMPLERILYYFNNPRI
tara:strand:+ start:57 stop:404 length:348 start_codon:yes stop_codon:yes gene_type:complete